MTSDSLSPDDSTLLREVLDRESILGRQLFEVVRANPDRRTEVATILAEKRANILRIHHLTDHATLGPVVTALIAASNAIERMVSDIPVSHTPETRRLEGDFISSFTIAIGPKTSAAGPPAVGGLQMFDAAGRVWMDPSHIALFFPDHPSEAGQPSTGQWAMTVVSHGLTAILAVWEQMTRDGAVPQDRSMLVWMSDLIAQQFRRQVLIETLDDFGWNLSKCSNYLRMGGSANVLRQIRDLGLEGRYEEEKNQRSSKK